MSYPADNLPLFLILTDSHGKFNPPIVTTTHYNVITRLVSSLQWIKNYNNQLCIRSLVPSTSISSLLSSCADVLFLIGTNSVRNTTALQIIEQVKDIIAPT